ncbi:hypothetical protein B0I35DRAFT_443453 [Stachybotrys elegans]|uniref:Zn(2)-C6 fungal-type domain-containing protein n=1 Tax=Stachybotrys elegans TaxID=80388 RepID=A0A8K0WKR7_9HYPO|nr:hypothetical protein B0I35DRAFT_443453 [Stachybotrys elegans]
MDTHAAVQQQHHHHHHQHQHHHQHHQQQQHNHQSQPEESTPCSSRSSTPPKRLRLACDSCHSAKIRCSGGQPCKKCQNSYVPPAYTINYMRNSTEAENKMTKTKKNKRWRTVVGGHMKDVF